MIKNFKYEEISKKKLWIPDSVLELDSLSLALEETLQILYDGGDNSTDSDSDSDFTDEQKQILKIVELMERFLSIMFS